MSDNPVRTKYKLDDLIEYYEKDTNRVYILKIVDLLESKVRCEVLNHVPTKDGRTVVIRVDFSYDVINSSKVKYLTDTTKVLYGKR